MFKKTVISAIIFLLLVSTLSLVSNAKTILSGSCGGKTVYTLTDEGELIISGSGAMSKRFQYEQPFYSSDKAILEERRNSITKITVKNGITIIHNESFADLEKVTSITLPNTLKVIDTNAFQNCKSLKEIYIPESVETIYDEAFMGCEALEKINIPENIEKISNRVFQECYSLQKISISENNKYYSTDKYGIIYNKDKTTLLACPGGVKGEITIPRGVKTIKNDAFLKSQVTKVIIPETVKTIGENAFAYCPNLKNVSFNTRSYTEFNESVFKNSKKLVIFALEKAEVKALAKKYSIPTLSLEKTPNLENFKKEYFFWEEKFSDVKKKDWFFESVKNAFEYSLMLGTSNDFFSPQDEITLAQVITTAARLHKNYYEGNIDFVQGDVWYDVYVDYCIKNDIISANDFSDYNKKATRKEFAAILSKALPAEEFTAINYTTEIYDLDETDKNFKDVLTFYRAGIIVGSGENHEFKPNSNITRAEAAAILTRMIDVNLRERYI